MRTLRDVLDAYRGLRRARHVLDAMYSLEGAAQEVQAAMVENGCGEDEDGSGGGEEGGGTTSLAAGADHVETAYTKPLRALLDQMSKFEALVEATIDLDSIAPYRDAKFGEAYKPGSGDNVFRRSGRRVLVKPSSTPVLKRLHAALGGAREKMHAAAAAARKVLKLEPAETRVKLETNDVHGCHLRVTKRDRGPLDKAKDAALPGKRILSTQKAGVLFTTTALSRAASEHERLTASYDEEQHARAAEVVAVASTYARIMARAGRLLSEVDVLAALAETAAVENWCCPQIILPQEPARGSAGVRSGVGGAVEGASVCSPASCGASTSLIDIQALRHPVVEANLAVGIGAGHGLSARDVGAGSAAAGSLGASSFVPNDVRLGGRGLGLDGRCAIITGPNW